MNEGDLTTFPSIDILSNLDSQIGTWNIKLTVSLTYYPAITMDQYFKITIEPCIVDSLVAEGTLFDSVYSGADKQNLTQYILNPSNRDQLLYNDTLFAFQAFYPSSYEGNQLEIPEFTQEPLCNYDLKFELFMGTDGTYTDYESNIQDIVTFASLQENTDDSTKRLFY